MQFEKKLSIIYLVLAESNSCDARIESAVMLGEYYYTHMIKWLQSSWFYKCSWAKKITHVELLRQPCNFCERVYTSFDHIFTTSLKKRSLSPCNFVLVHLQLLSFPRGNVPAGNESQQTSKTSFSCKEHLGVSNLLFQSFSYKEHLGVSN